MNTQKTKLEPHDWVGAALINHGTTLDERHDFRCVLSLSEQFQLVINRYELNKSKLFDNNAEYII